MCRINVFCDLTRILNGAGDTKWPNLSFLGQLLLRTIIAKYRYLINVERKREWKPVMVFQRKMKTVLRPKRRWELYKTRSKKFPQRSTPSITWYVTETLSLCLWRQYSNDHDMLPDYVIARWFRMAHVCVLMKGNSGFEPVFGRVICV